MCGKLKSLYLLQTSSLRNISFLTIHNEKYGYILRPSGRDTAGLSLGFFPFLPVLISTFSLFFKMLPVLQHLVEMALPVPIRARIINAHAQLDILENSVKLEVSKNLLNFLVKNFEEHLYMTLLPSRVAYCNHLTCGNEIAKKICTYQLCNANAEA
jgi:hypothetical protein